MINVISLNASHAVRAGFGEERLGQDQRLGIIDAYATCKGINAYRTANALRPGAHRLLLTLGGHVGKSLADELRREGLPFEAVRAESEHRRIVVVERMKTRRQIEWKGSRMLNAADLRALGAVACERISPEDTVVIAGSLPAGPSLEDWVAFLRALDSAGGRLVLDCSQFRELAGAGIHPWIVKVNHSEWGGGDLARSRIGTLKEEAMGLVERSSVHAVIITDGRRGAVGVTAGEAFHVRTARPRRGWALGCGDAFTGGLCVALDEGKAFGEALKMATACAVANLATPIPGEICPEEMERLQGEVRLKSL